MPAILTITLNPAVDISTETAQLLPSHKLRCGPSQRFPGGGGINVARVIHRLGGDCVALYLAGGVVGQQLRHLIALEHLPSLGLAIGGETRESFSVLETSSGREYRFVLPGPEVSQPEWKACLAYLDTIGPAPEMVVLSGSLPPGLSDDSYARLARSARARGSKIVLDSSGAALAQALAEGVMLIKPSLRELCELSGRALDTQEQQHTVARQLVDTGQTELVALSLGEHGAMLVSAQGAWRAEAMQVQVKSTTGAGDSFLAAMVWALTQGMAPVEAFRHGVAAGSAALLHPGTELSRADDVMRLAPRVQIRQI